MRVVEFLLLSYWRICVVHFWIRYKVLLLCMVSSSQQPHTCVPIIRKNRGRWWSSCCLWGRWFSRHRTSCCTFSGCCLARGRWLGGWWLGCWRRLGCWCRSSCCWGLRCWWFGCGWWGDGWYSCWWWMSGKCRDSRWWASSRLNIWRINLGWCWIFPSGY